MELKKHQIKYAKGYKDKELVAHEGGTGKTVCASVWLRDGRDSDALVICPKRVIEKWKIELKKWGTKATVVSKEQFKKLSIRKYSALVVDEADEFASPLYTRSRSKLTEALYNLIKSHDMPTLLCTATPVRSNPANLHTLLTFLRIEIDWKKWRNEFYELVFPHQLPFLTRPAWMPKEDWRYGMRPLLEKHADIVLLKDCVYDLPPVYEELVTVPCPPYKRDKTLEPAKAFSNEHRHEQEMKVPAILKIAKEYRKVLVVAYYVEQVEALSKALAKDRETFAIWGGVKDQEAVIAKATVSDECFFIVQASLGVGFDADTFSCVVFASMSYKVRDYVQMKYRVRRIHNLHPVAYYYLVGGRCDRGVYETIQLGKDFVPSEWI